MTAEKEKPIKAYRAKLKDIKTMEDNPNAGSERGQYLLETSFEKLGAGRSGLIADDGTIIAGNHATETFGAQGGEEIIIVETTGDEMVYVKRKDIETGDTEEARLMAIMDNRTTEKGLVWDGDVLSDWQAEGIDLEIAFKPAELNALTYKEPEEDFFDAAALGEEGEYKETYIIYLSFETQDEFRDAVNILEGGNRALAEGHRYASIDGAVAIERYKTQASNSGR